MSQSERKTALTDATTGPVSRVTSSCHLQAALDVLRRVVVRVDEVLRTHERDAAVDDDDLAVVAQVGALVLALERHDRQHPRPLHADAVELGERLLRVRRPSLDETWSASSRTVTPRATARSIAAKNPRVVSSHATMKNSTCTNVVRRVDLGGHRVDRGLVVADQRRAVAADRGQGGEVLVLLRRPAGTSAASRVGRRAARRGRHAAP